MTAPAALIGLNLGRARLREAAAKAKAERWKVSPEARAIRVAVLEARDAKASQDEADARAAQEAAPTALEAILSRGSIDELAEVSRSISRLDGRRLQEMVDDAFRAKARNGYQPDDEATQKAKEAPSAARASSASSRR